MKYRRLDSNHDVMFGQGIGDYVIESDAVAQAVNTRLLLFEGEWWLNINDGLPMFQQILGKPASQKVLHNTLILERIKGTINLHNVESFESTQDTNNGAYSFQCVVNTAYGTFALSNVQGGIF